MSQTEEQKPARALALDALRGIAVVLMCLSGRVPFDQNNLLPRWMYHAQEYPGGYGGTEAPAGFTWVDWVFPMFLFSMGVAFPFAQQSRLKRGATTGALIWSAFLRGLLIAAFAIYFQHVQPDGIDATATINVIRGVFGMGALAEVASWWKYVFAFVGFLVLIPVYTRIPLTGEGAGPTRTKAFAIKSAGIGLAIVLLAVLRYRAGALGTTFDIHRSNIILMVLANMAFFGTTVWLLTRKDKIWRWVFLAMFYAVYEAAKVPGTSLNFLFSKMWKPIDWIYSLNYLKYLFIVVPATMVGDAMMRFSESGSLRTEREKKWDVLLAGMVVIASGFYVFNAHSDDPYVTTVFCLFLAFGLSFSRETVSDRLRFWYLLFPAIVAIMVIFVVFEYPSSSTILTAIGALSLIVISSIELVRLKTIVDRFSEWLLVLGLFWIGLGILFSTFDGAIRKTPSNMAYYFLSLGLSIVLLMVLQILIDRQKKQSLFRPFIATGQNPMAGYMAINNVMEPIVLLSLPILVPVCAILMKMTNAVVAVPYPWHLFFWAVFKTALLVAITSALTRMKIIWRT